SEKIAQDSLLLRGDLTLRNIPACIQFQTFLRVDENMLEAKTDSITLDRTDWGIFAMSKNHSTGDQSYIVSDTIYIQINLIANQIDEKEERFD
ncbi:MAG TPA: YceI family protein, partial [Bacteroidales bacterium]|nr:YceI family protein [Bacteroidales bacterium]